MALPQVLHNEVGGEMIFEWLRRSLCFGSDKDPVEGPSQIWESLLFIAHLLLFITLT